MEDSTIVQMYWDRDENAISVTDEKYGAYCLSIARNILGNEEDAEECVNDTYLNTWNSIPTNRPRMLSTYLGKIIRNLSFNQYKKAKAKKRGQGQMPLVLDELTEVLSTKEGPEAEIDRKQLISEINEFLKTLSPKHRRIFVCRYWYADSVKDVALKFGMTENNVSVILSRLRSRFRDYLIESGYEL